MSASPNVGFSIDEYNLRDERGKTPNKAKVAVVNELVRWIWAIGRMVEGEQAA